MNKDLRTIYKVTRTKVRMYELQPGDEFEIYEDDGNLLCTAIATGQPNEIDGVWGIDADIKE